MWFIEQLHPRTSAFNLPLPLRIDGPVQLEVLRGCLNEIVRRHAVLRASFPTVNGRPRPVVASDLELPVPLIDLSGRPDAEAEAIRMAALEAAEPFELGRGPLVRAKVIRFAADRHLLCWTAHHIVSDGWSNWLILRELVRLYPALLAGRPGSLPPLSRQYWDYVWWQRDRLEGATFDQELAYWRRAMAGAPATSTISPDVERPATPVFRGARRPYELPADLTSAINKLARRERVTPFMVLLAGFQVLLCRSTGQHDVVVGVPAAGRVHVEFEELVGPFVNTLPVRLTMAESMSFTQILRRVRAGTIEASQHQELPFDRLVEELCPRRQASVHPVYQVMLAVLQTPSTVPELPGLTVTTVPLDGVQVDQQLCTVMLDLTLCISRGEDRYAGHLEYNAALYHPDTIARLLADFTGLLERVVTEPGLRLRELAGPGPMLAAPFTLAAGPSRQLRALAAANGLELETVAVAAWALLVSRYAREPDVVIGYDDASGDTGPLRVAVSEQTGILDWLAGLQRHRDAIRRHEQVPEPLIRERSEVSPAAALFSHRFAFRETAAPRREAGSGVPAGQAEALRIQIDDTGSGLGGSAVYRADLFEPGRVPAMMGHLARIMAGFAADPAGRLADADMLTEPDLASLRGWNATARSYPASLGIHEMFSAQVAANPDKAAVVYGDREVRYRELDEAAARWADRLRRLGVGPDRLVGVHVRRGPEMVALMLGVLRAGGAYVPLDPAYPFERLAFMASDARLTVLVTDTDTDIDTATDETQAGGAWSRLPCPVLSLDGLTLAPTLEPTAREPATTRAEPGPDAGQLAYVLYTSGSTGRPNGVAITHRSAVDLLHWVREVFAEDLECVLATTSICFDCSILEIFGPLCWGGTAVLADSALDLRSLPAGRRVHLMHTVPSVMAELLRYGGPPSALRTVILGGESPWPALIQQLRDRGHIERIFNLYGPTEVTSYATAALLGKSGLSTPPSIGRPVANTEVHVLDPYGNPVPAGVPGELYVAGAGLARGYLHQPTRTAERFVPDRFAGRPGARMYRTGDLASYRPDGTITFLGRVDDQVKVRGVRIEPGEIEQALLRHPAVTDAVVIPRDDGPATVALSAYVAVAGPPPRVSELRDHLRALLPSYLVPGAITVGELPRLPNGKLDRRGLRLDEQSLQPGQHRPYVAPRLPAEHTLAQLWATLLGLRRVGIDDNFFELGGDSFLVIRMISHAEEAGLSFSVTDVLVNQTVAELAAVASNLDAEKRVR